VKIFKTSILVFKDRDKYVSGEFRFRNGYCKSNPRKMVKTWAEKEMRNLKRLQAAGIPSPAPHLLKSHVLIMDFLGVNGWCAPRLKDANLNIDELLDSYKSIVLNMRVMYQECNLVHGDLSEYNLLLHLGQTMIIDVSQSVEHNHPFSSEFLRKDVANVTDFFARKGLTVLSKTALYHFIVEKSPNSRKSAEDRLEELLQQVVGAGEEDEAQQELEEAVFMQAYLPTSLGEISNPYAELQRMQAGQREKGYLDAVQSMIAEEISEEEGGAEDSDEDLEALLASLRPKPRSRVAATGDSETTPCIEAIPPLQAADADRQQGTSEDGGDDDEEGVSEDSDEGKYRRQLPSHDDPERREQEKNARKEARRHAKSEAALKRKNKIPKHVKKRAMKAGKK
jgi:RIO kinase 1